MPKIVTIKPEQEAVERPTKAFSKVARQAIDAGKETAQSTLESIPKSIPQAEKTTRAASRIAEEAVEQGTEVLDTLAEQTRRNVETAEGMARAVSWPDIVAAQREFLASSFERGRQLQDSYLTFLRATYKAMMLPTVR